MALADWLVCSFFAPLKVSLSIKCTRKIVAAATNDLREDCSLIIIMSRVHVL